MKAIKENKSYTVNTDEEAKTYVSRGYDIQDDNGEIKEYGLGKKISVDDYNTLKKENSKWLFPLAFICGDENSIISAAHIDILTFNRIDFEKLSEMQKRIIGRVHSRLTAFEEENADMISSYLKNYNINGVGMEFGASWNLMCISGVAIPADLYSLLKSTGLCYPAI